MNTKIETLIAEWTEELHTFTHDDADKYIDLVNRTIAALRQADQQSQPVACKRCGGSGFEDHEFTQECDECNGSGFTYPPAQPQVRELTDEEIIKLFAADSDWLKSIRAVIAADRAIRPAEGMDWLDANTTFFDVTFPVTEGPNVPTLATVSKRIWYHATDDQDSYPFSKVIAASQKENNHV